MSDKRAGRRPSTVCSSCGLGDEDPFVPDVSGDEEFSRRLSIERRGHTGGGGG